MTCDKCFGHMEEKVLSKDKDLSYYHCSSCNYLHLPAEFVAFLGGIKAVKKIVKGINKHGKN